MKQLSLQLFAATCDPLLIESNFENFRSERIHIVVNAHHLRWASFAVCDENSSCCSRISNANIRFSKARTSYVQLFAASHLILYWSNQVWVTSRQDVGITIIWPLFSILDEFMLSCNGVRRCCWKNHNANVTHPLPFDVIDQRMWRNQKHYLQDALDENH